MRIIIRDRNEKFINCFHKYSYSKNLELQCDDIFANDDWEAVVSPANSFGFMNGGIDLVYVNKFGQQLEDRVRKDIADNWYGELLVGQATFVDCQPGMENILIVAPTMRVPQRILDPVDVYLATKAAVRCALEIQVDSLLMPGMGTGVGQVSFETASKNMLIGIKDAIEGMSEYASCAMAHFDNEKFR